MAEAPGEGIPSVESPKPIHDRVGSATWRVIESQKPSAHAERLMRLYKKVTEPLLSKVVGEELASRLRKPAEAAAKVAGVGITSAEVLAATAALAVPSILVARNIRRQGGWEYVRMLPRNLDRRWQFGRIQLYERLSGVQQGIQDRVSRIVDWIRRRPHVTIVNQPPAA